MKRSSLFFILLTVFSLVVFTLCKKDNNTSTTTDTNTSFDKQAMLVNLADQLIIPSYQQFQKSLDSLNQTFNQFILSPDSTALLILQQKFYRAYLNYQRIDLFEFGPAETQSIRNSFNVFPADTTKINNNIALGSYQLSELSNIACKGFPALDFLFFGSNSSHKRICDSFKNSSNKRNYVTDLLSEMTSKTNNVVHSWTNEYRSTFVNSLATDVGSSIGFLVNQLNAQLDYLKNGKIGIPLGKKTLGSFLPEKSEAFYSAIYSKEFAFETLNLIETCYAGKSINGTNGLGFDDYLLHLKVMRGANLLDSDIQSQFSICKTKLAAIPNPLNKQFSGNTVIVDAAYSELVKLLVLLKTDMPSALGVIITYQDGDGD